MQLRKLHKKNQSLNINEKKLTIQLPFHKVSYYYFTKFADEKVCTHKKKNFSGTHLAIFKTY